MTEPGVVPDDEALRSVCEAEHERLWRSLLAYAGDADVASDAAAEAFAQALRRADGLRDPAAWWWAPGRVAWEPLPDLAGGLRTQLGSMAWTGEEVAVWGESTGADGVGAGALWRPGDDGWTPMSPSPQGPVRTFDGTAGSQAVAADRAGGGCWSGGWRRTTAGCRR